METSASQQYKYNHSKYLKIIQTILCVFLSTITPMLEYMETYQIIHKYHKYLIGVEGKRLFHEFQVRCAKRGSVNLLRTLLAATMPYHRTYLGTKREEGKILENPMEDTVGNNDLDKTGSRGLSFCLLNRLTNRI